MAHLIVPKSEDEVKKLTVANLRKAYNDLSRDYMKIIDCDYVYCGKCNSFLSTETFYSDKRFASGYFPVCKKCLLAMVEQRNKKGDPPRETKDSVKAVLRFMDLPYIDSLYESVAKSVADEVNEKNRKSPFLAYIVPIKSLPNYRGKTWIDSEFEVGVLSESEETKQNEKTIKAAKKRFGHGFSNEDYMYLETEYKDWTTRYACEHKSQEELFKRLCFKSLDILKAQKEGKDTKDLDKTYQELLGTLGIKPSQNSSNALTEAKTFGQLIQKWEDEKPIPEPEDEFKDVDKIGLYLDVFFKGHLAKSMGLNKVFSAIYDKFMSKFTVTKPQYDEDLEQEMLFEQIFGAKLEEE